MAWASVRSLLIMSELYNLNSRSIDFVLAHPQTEVKTTIHLASLARIKIKADGEDVVLRLKKNLYGLKDAGRTWWEHFSAGLDKLGFRKHTSVLCVWKKDGVLVIVYVDNCLILAMAKQM